MNNLTSWAFVLIAAINSTIGNLLLKKSSGYEATKALHLILNPYLISGLFFYGLSVIFFSRGLTRLPVSIAYPVLASAGFIMLALSASIFLDERLSIFQWAGMAMILAGITLLTNS